jgi:hypothetical protein
MTWGRLSRESSFERFLGRVERWGIVGAVVVAFVGGAACIIAAAAVLASAIAGR